MQTLRDNVSSVNLDEEMVKMIQFQRSYQMAAKLINVADTLLSSLLETVR
jgi:flagellar hook-associated protein 1 FlgK